MNEKILEIAKECGAFWDVGDYCFGARELQAFALRMKQEALLEAANYFQEGGYDAHATERLFRMAEQLGKGE